MKRRWFGPKTFGWGASPASWEGWVATGVFVVALVGVSLLIQPTDSAPAWIARGVVLAAFLAVVAATYRRDAGA